MPPSCCLVLLTDTDGDPMLVNLAQVTYICVNMNGSTCITFASRDFAMVQDSVQTIATLIAAREAGKEDL